MRLFERRESRTKCCVSVLNELLLRIYIYGLISKYLHFDNPELPRRSKKDPSFYRT